MTRDVINEWPLSTCVIVHTIFGNMIDFFEANSTEANEMVTNMVLYAGSRTLSSSPHFKAADISSF